MAQTTTKKIRTKNTTAGKKRARRTANGTKTTPKSRSGQRAARSGNESLKIPAIRVRQSKGRVLYTFALDGKVLPDIATITRIRRTESHEIEGYQRPEVVSHISEIRNYLESERPMIPNAIVVAFDSRVKFQPTSKGSQPSGGYSDIGTLIIPIDASWDDEDKPGFVVDGQQRLAAIREAKVKAFPICVTAFVTDDLAEQTEQFILVNSTKPLPKGLIYELLPTTEAKLPTLLHRRRFPAHLMTRLNHEEASPLKGLIQTPTNPEGIIKDNSILRMLENSLTDGALYRYRDPGTSGGDEEAMLGVLFNFWDSVQEVFPDAWGVSPRKSRLMHGAGIASMGFVMDAISDRYRRKGIPSKNAFQKDIVPLADSCRWTDGYWDFGPGMQRKWNELQNTSKDIQLLTNYLIVQYKSLVWSRSAQSKTDGRQQHLSL